MTVLLCRWLAVCALLPLRAITILNIPFILQQKPRNKPISSHLLHGYFLSSIWITAASCCKQKPYMNKPNKNDVFPQAGEG